MSDWIAHAVGCPTHKVTRRASARSLLTAVLGAVFEMPLIFNDLLVIENYTL